MTPDMIKRATEALAGEALNTSDARSAGAAFGRALAAQIRAREIATEQMNSAAATTIELSLLQLAASSDERLADVADSALQALHHVCPRFE